MRKRMITLTLFAVTGGALAQAPPASPTPTPESSPSLSIALASLHEKQQQLGQQFQQLNSAVQVLDQEVRQRFPGHHIDFQTLQIVSDTPAPAPSTTATPATPAPPTAAPQPSPAAKGKKK